VTSQHTDSEEKQPVTPGTLRLIYDELAQDLDKQFSQIESLNNRAQQLLGLAGLIPTIVVTIGILRHRVLFTALFAVALASFAGVATLAFLAWRVKGWRADPNAAALWSDFRFEGEEWLRHQVIQNRLQSRAENEKHIQDRLWFLKRAQWGFAASSVYVIVVLLVLPYVSDAGSRAGTARSRQLPAPFAHRCLGWPGPGAEWGGHRHAFHRRCRR
jgi:hypothetical protein